MSSNEPTIEKEVSDIGETTDGSESSSEYDKEQWRPTIKRRKRIFRCFFPVGPKKFCHLNFLPTRPVVNKHGQITQSPKIWYNWKNGTKVPLKPVLRRRIDKNKMLFDAIKKGKMDIIKVLFKTILWKIFREIRFRVIQFLRRFHKSFTKN